MEKNDLEYSTLKEFIQIAGMTYADFARVAEINKYSFQTMLQRNYNLKIEIFDKIARAMQQTIEQEPDGSTRLNLQALYAIFVNGRMLIHDPIKSNPPPPKRIVAYAACRKEPDAISDKKNNTSNKKRGRPPKSSIVSKSSEEMTHETLSRLYNSLNEIGQQKVLEYAVDLTYNPKYQKQAKE